MAGFGLQPAGTSSAGFGSPTRGAEEGGVILRDEATGASFGGRKIDPRTGDYVLDNNGRLLGMQNVQQRVMLLVLDAGPDLAAIDKLTEGFERAATAILTAKLEPLVREGVIQVLGVRDVRMGTAGGLKPGQAIYKLFWRDLSTNIEHRTEI